MYGAPSLRMWSDGGTFQAGVFTQVSGVQPGVTYKASAGWFAPDHPPDDFFCRKLGIDPNGGTDAAASTVVWGPTYCGPGRGVNYPPPDVNIDVSAAAQSSTVTVFAYVNHTYSTGANKIFLDAVELIADTSQPAQPPPTDTPVPQAAAPAPTSVPPTPLPTFAPTDSPDRNQLSTPTATATATSTATPTETPVPTQTYTPEPTATATMPVRPTATSAPGRAASTVPFGQSGRGGRRPRPALGWTRRPGRRGRAGYGVGHPQAQIVILLRVLPPGPHSSGASSSSAPPQGSQRPPLPRVMPWPVLPGRCGVSFRASSQAIRHRARSCAAKIKYGAVGHHAVFGAQAGGYGLIRAHQHFFHGDVPEGPSFQPGQ